MELWLGAKFPVGVSPHHVKIPSNLDDILCSCDLPWVIKTPFQKSQDTRTFLENIIRNDVWCKITCSEALDCICHKKLCIYSGKPTIRKRNLNSESSKDLNFNSSILIKLKQTCGLLDAWNEYSCAEFILYLPTQCSFSL